MATHAPSDQAPAVSPEHAATQRVADRFLELCRAGRNRQAIEDLYADNARHVEVADAPWCPRIIAGKPDLLKKADEFERTVEVHGATYDKPIVNGDQYVCTMGLDCTSKEGPMAGQRMQVSEVALYTVRDGRIVEGKFFYGCGG